MNTNSNNETTITIPPVLASFWGVFGSLIKWCVIGPALWGMSLYAFAVLYGIMEATS